MRKRKGVIILIILILVLVSCVVLQNKETMVNAIRKTFFKATTVATGTTGTCNWTLDSDGLLLIEPTNGVSGTMGESAISDAYKSQVKSIKFNATVYAPGNSSELFSEFNQLNSFYGRNLNTQNVVNMTRMFYNCQALTELDVSNFNTENVRLVIAMFEGCEALTELDLSNFYTPNVDNMQDMFRECRSLVELDISNFDTQNVFFLNCMFMNCESLVELDLSSFNSMPNMYGMGAVFEGCKSLKKIDVSSFNTQSVSYMDYMFAGCESLTELDISNFDTQNVTSMTNMLLNCPKLKSLTLGSDFSFIHKTNELSTYSTPWVKQGTTTPRYTSSELMNAYNGSTMAGTYVRINIIRISINKNDESWNTNNIKVALYQDGTEVYSYSQGEISQGNGTITWYDVAPGTYDIYASKNTNEINTLVDTGKDIVAPE